MSTHVIAVTDRLVTVRTLYATKDGRTVKDVRYAARFDAATAERIAAGLRERRGALKPGGWRHLGDSNGRGRTYGPGDAATIRAVAVSEIATAGAHPKLTPDECAALYSRANAAGMLAGEAATPTPMTVVERANPIDDRSSVQRAWIVADGACGFAWVNVSPGTSRFARWLMTNQLAHAAYGGGVDVWIRAHGQSLTRKQAHAHAMASVLREAGINAYAESRID